mgnify:CR=1 FL=1
MRFGVGPLLPSAEDTKKAYTPFFSHVAQQLGVDFELVATTDWAGMAVAMGSGQLDLAWMGPWGYIIANNSTDCQAIATVKYDEKPTYVAIVIAKPELKITNFPADSKGMSISFADAGSTSGWLIPTYYAKEVWKIDPKTFWKYTEGATHAANEVSVSAGQVDMATDFDRNRNTMIEGGRVKADANKIVWTSAPQAFGFPHFNDKYWDPLWATAQEMNLPIALHHGSLAIEQQVFEELAAAIAVETQALNGLAAALADLDCEAGLAELAVAESYVRPTLADDATFDIRGGRHPVVEQALKADKASAFIANDCVLAAARPEAPDGFDETSEARLWLVTGPNMAGKSTFLRQNALIAVMAQMGAFVPATSAHIGLVDRLFSRVGASDDLARGRSTFMVEMVETAAILNQAGERSLVILDEIGRGTATYDGLSIAWAVVEYLHDISRCRALFATHYHELTALAQRLDGVANVSMDVREWRDEIVFLHKVKAGAADRSYGIQVGKLAGLPKAVTKRARQVLERLERESSKSRGGEALIDELPLFAAREAPESARTAEPDPVATALAAINPDELTPKAALEALYRLKALASGDKD